MAKLISNTYGEALFGLALEKGLVDELMEEIRDLQKILSENPEFSRLMNHPDISRQEKLSVLKEVFEGRLSDELYGFLRVLIEKGRYGAMEDIFADYVRRFREHQRIGVAYITSAIALDERQQEKIERRLLETTPYEKIELHLTTDASLIGGLVIRIGDRVVDSSIRTRLEGLSRQLMRIQI